MKAMVLNRPGTPLCLADVPRPSPGPGEVLIEVSACGVCRTDVHIADGDLADAARPLIPGHQVVGRVRASGPQGLGLDAGARVGVPWLGYACGTCRACVTGRENLCHAAQFTGYQRPGGFAEYMTADARFCFPIPPDYPDVQAAPLLCAGVIGYRALRLAGDAGLLGFYGFGASARLLIQVARHQGRRVFVFVRPGDSEGRRAALEAGAAWAGDSGTSPPEPVEAALIFAPAGHLVPAALRATARGGTVVCAGIHMSTIPALDYRDLWHERCLRSVANLTRRDGEEFLSLAPRIPIRPVVRLFDLDQANAALAAIRDGTLDGSAVLAVRGPADSTPRAP